MPGRRSKKIVIKEKDTLLPKLTTTFFDRPWLTALLWLSLSVFGLFSYTTLLRREGFPSIQIPITVVSGTYFANDPAKVDAEVAKPIADIALSQDTVSSIQTQSSDNFFNATIQYKEGTDSKAAAKSLEQAVKDSGRLPESAAVEYNVPYFGATGGDIEQIDVAISFYHQENAVDTAGINAKASEAVTWLSDKRLPHVKSVFVKSPYETSADLNNGEQVTVQRTFDRYGVRTDNTTVFYNSVIIGIAADDSADIIELHKELEEALRELARQPQFEGYDATISASFAPSIEENISELQRVLLEGLLAVLIVSSLVIAIRASVITVISMVTVLILSLGFLFLIGYTLNVITLFALILSLALIVDDTIIMVEAIDAARGRTKERRHAVKEATRKVSRAMVAATLTAALSFAPLLFVGGILGSFIQAIPITIISSLIISLLVALVFIPFFARFVLLGKKQMGKKAAKQEISAGFEARLAHFITKPMLWGRHSRRKLFAVGTVAILIGFIFIGGGVFIARNVVFNIFPPTKDTNGLVVTLNFPPNTTIESAESIAERADRLTSDVVGPNLVQASYYATGSAQSATLQVELVSYNKRDIRSPEIVRQLQERFDSEFTQAQAIVAQADIGPPAAAFAVQVTAENREGAFKAAEDIATYLRGAELERLNGTVAKMTNVSVSSSNQYLRMDNRPIVQVSAGFDGTDTTTLVGLAQDAIKQEFTGARLQQYSLGADALTFDLGQEEENQESFNTLVIAFPILLAVMYVLLAVQFRSLVQPLLIFLAIPFSFFGIMLGLDLTNNAISFFTMLGFFALVGLSIKNTILLTDFANQARHAGTPVIDSAAAALEERFRPLFATSMTAVVSLIPLALTSPFWEGLAVVLIFGLLSSTFLVVTVFPYYYLGAEYLRGKFSRTQVLLWLFALIGGSVALGMLGQGGIIPLWLLFWVVYPIVRNVFNRMAASRLG